MQQFVPVRPPPGIVRNNTEYGSRDRWWDANLIRWYGADLGPVLGWRARQGGGTLEGAARSILTWRDNSNARCIAVGTHSHLYHQAASGVTTDITPSGYVAGDINAGARSGFGEGPYGTGAFGVARPDTGDSTDATRWDLDNFGEQLVAVANTDGQPYYWDLDTGTDAQSITGAPTDVKAGIAVTEQRAVMLFGASGDTRNVAWSDLENMTDWTPTAENQAGDYNLATTGSIVKGLRVGPQMLILTTIDAHVATYRGPPFVYGFQRVATGCGVIAPGAAITAGQMAFWWSRNGFWRYDGGAVVPLPCDVQDFIDNDLNRGQRSKISGWHNARFGEVTWLYPSTESAEIDSYLTYSYRNGWWTIGTIPARGCGMEEGAFSYPLLVSIDADGGDRTGIIYEHERGFDYGDFTPYAETGPIGQSDQVIQVQGVIGDEATVGQVEIGFRTRMYPNAPETEIANQALTSRGHTDFRFTARQVRMRVEGAASEAWRFGTARIKIRPMGER